ncbi:MAG TPA: hypothetical protein VHV51_18130 [Polyangiaceae bacterium]|nr:hypothetical protein [Polyangiaceae bacterium]
MKKRALFLLTTAFAAGCSSSPDNPSPTNGGAGASAGGTGQSFAGSSNSGGSSAVAGGGANVAGSSASAGATIGGTSGAAGAGAGGASNAAGSSSNAGASGASGASGVAGATAGNSGAGGSAPVGDLPNQIPAGYTGKPFGGAPQQIPGKIEVERYDTGGPGVAFNAMPGAAFNACGFMRTDATALECTGQPGPQDQDFATCANYPAGSIYIGYIGGGNYYKYTVDVLAAGTYEISGHEGVSPTNTAVTFAFTDSEKTGNIALPSTNGKCTSEAYHVWSEQQNLGEITLTPGHYVMTLTVVNAGLNMDWFAFTQK